MSIELCTMSPAPPATSPLMMWPAFSTMSADRSTALVTMSRAASIASFGVKAMGVSLVWWLGVQPGERREARADAVRETTAGQLADLPTVFGAHHGLPVGRLGRQSTRVVALGADFLHAAQR